MCQRSISEKGEVTSVELPWRKGVMSSVPLRRCVCRLELRRSSREIDESKSEVINTVGVPQVQYIDRVVDIPVMRGRGCFLFLREACVCS